jgi:hypothetical protein
LVGFAHSAHGAQVGFAHSAHGAQVAITAFQVATGAVAQSGAFDHLPDDFTGDDNAGKVLAWVGLI